MKNDLHSMNTSRRRRRRRRRSIPKGVMHQQQKLAFLRLVYLC